MRCYSFLSLVGNDMEITFPGDGLWKRPHEKIMIFSSECMG